MPHHTGIPRTIHHQMLQIQTNSYHRRHSYQSVIHAQDDQQVRQQMPVLCDHHRRKHGAWQQSNGSRGCE